MKYVPTIGLEIHAELKTKSKMFCSCKNDPNEDVANVNVCPICLGHPGTLPVLNSAAIKKVLEIGIAVNGKLADFTEWDRKNYFYPDIPKGYQISQYKFPLISNGKLSGVELERIHLEEDTAQSTHDAKTLGDILKNGSKIDVSSFSLINFNRSGVPLLELVTKPVIHDAVTAVSFAKELQLLLRYLDASDANLEKGEMRVEANISVASEEKTAKGEFGTKTEVKNLNSFKAVEKAIAYEIDRQASLLDQGEKIAQETRGWDENKAKTFSQRSKESSHDYRYFPDPDIPKMKISEIPEFAENKLRMSLPELPWQKRERYISDFNMTAKEAAVFVESPCIASYFETVIKPFKGEKKQIKLSVNYILTDYLGILKKGSEGKSLDDQISTIPATLFSELIIMAANNEISSRGAKDLLALAVSGCPTSVRDLAESQGLLQKSSAADLEPSIDKVISDNPTVVAEYKGGKAASLQFLIGQAMKATKGAANPGVVKQLLEKKLG